MRPSPRVVALLLLASALATGPLSVNARHPQGQEELQRNFTKDVPFLAGGWAGIQRALLNVFGIVSEANQLDANYASFALVNKYYTDPEERAFVQGIAPSTFYLPTAFKRDPPPPPPPGEPAQPPGTECETIPEDMAYFLKNCAAFSQAPGFGRLVLLQDAAASLAARLEKADTANLLAYNGVQPEYLIEKEARTGVPLAGSNRIPGGVERDGAHVRIAAGAVLGDVPVEKFVHGVYANPSEETTGPVSADLPLPSSDALQFDSDVCTKDPLTNEPVCSSSIVQESAGLAGLTHTDCSTCRVAGAATAAVGVTDLMTGTSHFFSSSLPTRAEQFFGENFLLYQALLGPAEFWNKAQALFQAADSNDPPRPAVGPPQSVGACDANAAALSAAQAAGLAQLLGVDATARRWDVTYEPTIAVASTTGIDPRTGTTIALTPAHFRPSDGCVWEIAAASGGLRDVAIISDTTEAAGTEYRLRATESSLVR